MPDRTFRVGLVGWGNGGCFFHAPFIHVVPGLELVTVVTSRMAVKEQYPQVKVVSTVDDLLTDPSIDLVVVATPHKLHVSHVRAALKAGKHVVVDKPLAETAAEALDLIALAREVNCELVVYHNRRWDGGFRTVQRVLESGVLGHVYYYESHWPIYRPDLRGVWRENPDALGGMLYDLGPHMVDQVLHLFGQPDTVYAQLGTHRAGGRVDDMYRIQLQYASGLTALLFVDMVAPISGPCFHLRGTSGSYEKWGLDPQEAALRAGEMPVGETWGVEPEDTWGRLYARDLNGLAVDARIVTDPGDYRLFYYAVYEALVHGGTPVIDLDDVVLQLRILEAARESARTNSVQRVRQHG